MNIRNQLAFGAKTIPSKSDALVWLDGTISGNNFVDKISGKLFPITNKDFPTGWVKGFPYKSAATFSAPTGDAALIAKDVNGFFYTAGVPNQIPVTSCYQDVDYEHRLFFRHIGQSVDIDTMVETYEPRVAEMVLYNTAATGGDLTARNSYFNVPAEITTNVRWVAPNGLNTNDGSKASPWQTMTKGNTATAGYTVYVKTGIYTENGALANLNLDRSLSWKGLGLCEVRQTNQTYTILLGVAAVNTINFEGFIVNAQTKSIGIKTFGNTSYYNISRCYFKNESGYAISGESIAQTGNRIINCVFHGGNTNSILFASPIDIDTCYFSGTSTNNTIYNKTGGSAGNINLLNNRAKSSTASGKYFLLTDIVDKYNVLSRGNNIDITNLGGGIRISDQKSFDSIGDIINIPVTGGIPLVIGSSGTTSSKTSVVNCVVINKAVDGYAVSIGAETSGAGNGKLTNITVSKCLLLGAKYYNPSIPTLATHGIFVGYQNTSAAINLNLVDGFSFGVGIKGGLDYTSTTIKYNLIKNNKAEGVVLAGARNVKVYNNTFEDNSKEIYAYTIDSQGATGALIKNNIFKNTNGWIYYFADSASYSGHVINNNTIYFTSQLARNVSVDLNINQWQSAGFDTVSVNANPLLTNSIPASNSPSIGVGENLGASFNTGLDIGTNWGSETQLPNVVTKLQPTLWDCGAYIH